MTRDLNPYESPQATGNATPQPAAQRSWPAFFTLVTLQLLAAAVLAPADAGRWLRYTTIYLVLFDIVVCFSFVSAPRPTDRFWPLGAIVLIVGSLAIAVAGTYLTEYFQLP